MIGMSGLIGEHAEEQNVITILIAIASAWFLAHLIAVHRRRPKPTTEHERKVYASEVLELRGVLLGATCAAVFTYDPNWILGGAVRFVFFGVIAIAGSMIAFGSFRRKELERGGHQ